MTELAASIVGLMGAAKTCIDLWTIVTSTKSVNQDLDHLVNNLRTEQIRFLLWCHITGLNDLAGEVESRAPVSAAAGRRAPAIEPGSHLLIRPQTPLLLRQHVESVMTGMSQTLKQVNKMLKDYGAGPASSTMVNKSPISASSIKSKLKLQLTRITGPRSLPLLEIDELIQPVDSVSGSSSGSAGVAAGTIWTGFQWAVSGREAFRSHVSQLKLYNDGLRDVLDLLPSPHLTERYQRWLNTAAAATPLTQFMAGEQIVETVRRAKAPEERGLAILGEISKERRILGGLGQYEERQDANVRRADREDVDRRRSEKSFALGTREKIDADEVAILKTNGSRPERDLAFYKQNPVIVEWRYYSSGLSKEERNILDYRVNTLAANLGRCYSVPSFSILRCRGCFYVQQEKRYGLVFEYPSSATTPITLSQQLTDDYSKKIRRDLHERLNLAATICRALYHLFTIGWLHKNVRSDSILFFNDIDDGYHLPKAYLMGFGFSRRDSPMEITENRPSILNNPEEKERQIYTHPIRRQKAIASANTGACERHRPPRWNMLFDTYSLGVILIEVATWCPVDRLCSRKITADEFQDSIVDVYYPMMRFYMGEKYAAAARRCLEGGFGLISEDSDEDSIDTKIFLENFERLVVTELESLTSS